MTLARWLGRQNAYEVVQPAEHRRRHPHNHSARYFAVTPTARALDQTQLESFWIRMSTSA
jgi:hypothetical protein